MPRSALEVGFPIVEVSQIAEQESWRKEIYRPIYHIHKWWATRLGSVFRAITLAALSPESDDTWGSFYERHDFAGKVVLDPFMGSGTTLGEAVKLGAKAIGCDINPVSSFLVKQAFTAVSEDDLRSAFAKLEREIAPQIQGYYRTEDVDGTPLRVLYYFWVKVVSTDEGEVIPLFSRYVFAQDAYPKKKPAAQMVCRSCWGLIEARYDADAVTCAHCQHAFNPQQGPVEGQYVTDTRGARHRIRNLLPKDGLPPEHRLYAMLALRPDGKKVYLAARAFDDALFDEAERRLASEDLPLPVTEVRPGHNTDQARSYNYARWRQFFNARQLLCLGLLLRGILSIERADVREQLLCLFSSTLEFNNLFCSYKGEGTGAVRHMFSNHILKPERTPLENSVWGTEKNSGTFSTLFESRLLRAKQYLDDPFEVAFESDLLGDKTGRKRVTASDPINVPILASWEQLSAAPKGLLVLNGDSARLPIPDGSVDAVITDPPYFDFVHYSELSDFFFAWLAPALQSTYSHFAKGDSSDPGEVQQKDPALFAQQLGYVFADCSRVLKPSGVLAFSFHHSRSEGWAAIYQAVRAAGLYFVAAHPVHAELRAASPKTAAKAPISLDAILVCRKQPAALKTSDDDALLNTVEWLALTLEGAGMSLSSADRFVIAAALLLITASAEALRFDEYRERLDAIGIRLQASSVKIDAEAQVAA